MAEFVYIDDGYSTSAATLDYRILKDGVEIERGRAYGDDFPICVYLNRVAQAYLSNEFPTGSGVTSDSGACGLFTIMDMSGNTLYSQTYINGWAGTFSNPLSKPINGHLDKRMRFFYTVYSGTTGNIVINTQ